MKTITLKEQNGQLFQVETILYTGMDRGEHVVNKPFTYETRVYRNCEECNVAATERLAKNTNEIWISNEPVEIDGVTYWYPTFNVWD